MSKLSIFVDESGDFDINSVHSPYYLFTLVFHNQNNHINREVDKLDLEMERDHCCGNTIHSGPLIRREPPYGSLSIDERRNIFNKMFYFVRNTDFEYKTFSFYKKDYNDKMSLEGKMAKELGLFIRENLNFFQSYDEIVVYYDNGQNEINRLLNSVLNYDLNEVKFKKVYPSEYKLFQAADFVCTIELLKIKKDKKQLSKSENGFFYKKQELSKTYIKGIKKKKFRK